MAIENEGSTEKINGTYCYILHLYGHLINDQKALVTLIDIQVFFDILVPDNESPDECETKIRDILSGSMKTFSVENIKKAIQAIQENNFETASDDLYSFYQKVAQENEIKLSGWSTINKYICKKGKQTSPLFPHEFYISIKDFCPLENIKTYASQMEEFAEVFERKNKVFMISMTLHWKDDPKLLKQICLVDVEIEPDPPSKSTKSFHFLLASICLDIHIGFNDSDYDWCFIMERAYHLNILKWMWKRMTEKFKTKEEILKWKYREKLGVKSENDFMKKYPVKAPEKGKKDLEEKEYMGSPIKIKISVGDYFTSNFLKLPGCIPINI
ncbi:5225_t:CDS:2 [Funneliformis geosporum]|uniref:17461_t:CDS:1 n=1 Tax=Funneliformis geosporum TaxID=1117311 RepID=A0A9W4T1Q5_9GLOM|nr:17461_t:CDS:2 [Funneliformis geosporum]CAI2191397.1 5225_t:CDS:2 [Funneliformis geosporum]